MHEPPPTLVVADQIRGQNLERHLAVEPGIPCLIDLPHSALAEKNADLYGPSRVPDVNDMVGPENYRPLCTSEPDSQPAFDRSPSVAKDQDKQPLPSRSMMESDHLTATRASAEACMDLGLSTFRRAASNRNPKTSRRCTAS